jgi:arylsulfatase
MGESFDIGRDSGTPVTPEYKPHAEFTGRIKKVMVELAGEKHRDPETEARMSLVQE